MYKFIGIILLFLFISSTVIYAQNEWARWGKKTSDYTMPEPVRYSYIISRKSVGSFILSSLKNTYSFFISDLDGKNCPFYPSCSAFFVEAVQETNLFKGALMFADRFTRDTNIFKRFPYYPFYKSGRLYDPVDNYKLDTKEIKYYPRDIVVK